MEKETESKKKRTYYELQIGTEVDSIGYFIDKVEREFLPRDVQEGHTLLYYFTKNIDAVRFAKRLEEQRFLFACSKRKVMYLSALVGLLVGLCISAFFILAY